MKISAADIKRLNNTSKAKRGQRYEDFNGNKYIGTSKGTLQLLNPLDIATAKHTKDSEADIVKLQDRVTDTETDIDTNEAAIKKLKCEQIAFTMLLG